MARRGRVLICEDRQANYAKLREYLQYEGFDVVDRVETEEEVRKNLRMAREAENYFHIIFIDIDLSCAGVKYNGVEMYERIRESFPFESYVIYTTQRTRGFRELINQLMYRDVQLILLDEMMQRQNVNLHLARLIQDRTPERVFLVHGRNQRKVAKIKRLMEEGFGLTVVGWEAARRNVRQARPSIYDIVLQGIEMSQATVVLFTDDEEVRLRKKFATSEDYEKHTSEPLQRQARPNVFIEAGYAHGVRPRHTLFVSWPDRAHLVRWPSDFEGSHFVRFDNKGVARDVLRSRLLEARCVLSLRPDWQEFRLD